MKKKNQLLFWHLGAVLLFFVLSIAYFAPSFFQGKEMHQGDTQSVGSWQKELVDFQKITGESSAWSNATFSGMPSNVIKAQPSVNIFQSIALFFKFGLNGLHIAILLLCFLGFYLLLLSYDCKPWMAILGACAFSLSCFNIVSIGAGHLNKVLAMATMAPIIGGVILMYRSKYLWGMLLCLTATGLNVFYSHQQISYYVLIILLCISIAYFIEALKIKQLKRFFKTSLILVIIAVLAVLPAIGSLWPTYDYSKASMRGGAVLKANATGVKESTGLDIDYAYQWSYGPMESFTLLIPNLYGGSSNYNLDHSSATYQALKQTGQANQFCKNAPTYWGAQPFTSGPAYAGAIICLLFILGLFIVEGPEKWWILAATLISLLLAWGKNLLWLNEFLFYHLPLYSKFRTPAMALVIAQVCMPLMAVLALKQVLSQESKSKYWKDIKYAAGITGGICLFFILFGPYVFDFNSFSDTHFPEWLTTALIQDRQSMMRSDAFRSLVFIALAFGALFFYKKEKLKGLSLVLFLSFMVIIDMWMVDKRFINDSLFVPKRQVQQIQATESDLLIMQDKDLDYRVFNASVSTFNDASTSRFHKSVGGYSPAKLRRYQDIIDYHFTQSQHGLNVKVLNMLNTRYFIVPNKDGSTQVQKNVAALGNAWFIDTIEYVPSPDVEIRALYDFDPAKTAIIDQVWKPIVGDVPLVQSQIDSSARIKLIKYAPNRLEYVTNNKFAQTAVFSEVFYKTWTATIDGKTQPIFRANYILRALNIPAGDHTIVFVCDDPIADKAAIISLYSSIFVGLLLLSLLGLCIREEIIKSQKK